MAACSDVVFHNGVPVTRFRRNPQRACEHKRKFASLGEAHAAMCQLMASPEAKEPERLEAYACGDHFHFGHVKKNWFALVRGHFSG